MTKSRSNRRPKKRPKKLAFKVKVPNIPGVTIAMWKHYIDDAVVNWCGQSQSPAEGELPDPWWLMVTSERMEEVFVTGLKQ